MNALASDQAKRLAEAIYTNERLRGKVTAGAEDASRNQSFIDNISLEYRLDSNSTRNLRLFYDNDTQDPLEGYYSTAGVGFVLRSKTNSLGELFLKPRKKTKDDAAH